LYIHPVHIIFFLAVVASITLTWIFLFSRRVHLARTLAGEEPYEVVVLRQRVAALEKITRIFDPQVSFPLRRIASTFSPNSARMAKKRKAVSLRPT
jgi:hypothetical protein